MMDFLMDASPLQKRLLFGVLMCAAIVAVFLSGPLAIKILSLFLIAFLAIEWSQICRFPLKAFPPLITSFVYSAIYAVSLDRSTLGIGVLLCLASLGLFLSWLSWYRRFLWMALGIVYIGLPFVSIFWILDHLVDGLLILAWVLGLVVINDVSAFFVGNWLKGPKLVEMISPSKTWSGFFGGLLVSSLSGGFFYSFIHTNMSIQSFMGISGLIALFSSVGDLFESKIKRIHKIKDSGKIIPGHGGIFDRVDGLLFVLPFVGLAFYLWPHVLLFSWRQFYA